MKVGDTVAVNIGASEVTNAKIVELGDGTATLVIPATRVVMAVRTELDTTPTAPSQGNEHAILGVEQNETPPNSIAGLPPVEGVAPVAETVEVTSSQSDAVTSAAPSSDSAAPVQETPTVVVEPPVAVAPVAEQAVTPTPEA